MAWNSQNTWKNHKLSKPKNDDSTFPGLKPAATEAAGKIEYEELQQNELLALEAIYGEDFVNQSSDGQSAWKVCSCSIPWG